MVESKDTLVPFLISVGVISQPAIEADLKVAKPFSSMDEEAFRSVDVAPPILAGVLIVLAVMSP